MNNECSIGVGFAIFFALDLPLKEDRRSWRSCSSSPSLVRSMAPSNSTGVGRAAGFRFFGLPGDEVSGVVHLIGMMFAVGYANID